MVSYFSKSVSVHLHTHVQFSFPPCSWHLGINRFLSLVYMPAGVHLTVFEVTDTAFHLSLFSDIIHRILAFKTSHLCDVSAKVLIGSGNSDFKRFKI